MAGTADDWHAALSAEVRTSARLLFKLAHGIVRDPLAAEDACQQALAKAWEARESIRDRGALRGWLARVVVNESLQIVRRRVAERAMIARAADERRARCGAWAIGDGEVRESVLLALERLPERSRTVVVLRLMQGLTGNEVKDLLGCSGAEVSRQLHDGMERLRPLLADWVDDFVG